MELTFNDPGPEGLTFNEKIVGLVHLPYFLGCTVLGLVIGAPGFFLLSLSESLSVTKAWQQLLANPFFSLTQFGQTVSPVQGIAESVLWTLFLIMTLYFTRYMRLKLVANEKELERLLEQGAEEKFHRAFGGAVRLRNALPFIAGFVLLYSPWQLMNSPMSLVAAVTIFPMDFIIIGLGLSLYLRALWGIYRFGKEDLRLKPYYEERMLGLRPLGSISLSFSIVSFTLVAVALTGSFISNDLSNFAVQTGLLLLLVVMIFLPLEGVHRKMAQAKAGEEAVVQARIKRLAEDSAKPSGLEDDRGIKSMSEIRSILVFRELKEEVSRIPTWPFDSRRLERFVAILVSVITIILGRLVIITLHL